MHLFGFIIKKCFMYVSIFQDFLIILRTVHLKLQLFSVLWKTVLRRDNFESILTTQIPGLLLCMGVKPGLSR